MALSIHLIFKMALPVDKIQRLGQKQTHWVSEKNLVFKEKENIGGVKLPIKITAATIALRNECSL